MSRGLALIRCPECCEAYDARCDACPNCKPEATMPLPPRTMSIDAAPRPGEIGVTLPIHARRPSARDRCPHCGAPPGRDCGPGVARVTPEQEEADAREQQAIADAVEGVIP